MARIAAVVAGVVCLAILLGCAGVQEAAKRAQRQNNMQEIGIAFHSHDNAENRAPENAGDLLKFIDTPETRSALTDGSVVFLYGVRPRDMVGTPAGSAGTVLAYEAVVETKGGYVLMGDSSVREVTSAEFANLPRAKKADEKVTGPRSEETVS